MNFTTEDDLSLAKKTFFQWPDYIMFSAMLLVSAGIGVYFGCMGTRQKSATEYLFGGRSMSVIPVAVSLVASHVSGVTLLGVPSEVYVYGTQYWLIVISSAIVGIVVNAIYIPVFHKLQLTSSFEYLERRFNRSVRLTASLFYTLALVLYVPIVVYLPALAFSQVSGVNLHLITPIVSSICIFYTTLGGIKAVVWTDFIQQITMIVASIIVIILGVIRIGGFSNMWRINSEGERIEFFNMDPSIFTRLTFFTTVIGWTFNYLATCGISQAMVQRFLSVPTLRKAKQTMIIFSLGMMICKTISCLTGLLIHAQYHDCDPLKTKSIKHQDQLLPYYVMDIAGHIPGLSGLFVAGVFSAALSTMSTMLNTVSGTIFEDFISLCISQKTKEKHASSFMKVIVLLMGILCVLMVFVVEKLGGAVQMTVSLGSITYGALLGLFTFGMLCPWANTKGALAGGIASLAFVGTLVVGSQSAVAAKRLVYPKKPTSIEGCLHLNASILEAAKTSLLSVNSTPEPPIALFRVSFMYFNLIGCFTVIIIGSVVSLLTRPKVTERIEVNRDLLSPVIHRWLPKIPEKEAVVGEPLLLNKIN